MRYEALLAERAWAYLATERSQQPYLHVLDAVVLATIASHITQADEAVRQVLEVVAPLALPTEASPWPQWTPVASGPPVGATRGMRAGAGGPCAVKLVERCASQG